MPLFEFTVEGRPLSHQSGDGRKLRAWKSKIRQAARRIWDGSPLTLPLKITVAYYHEGDAALIDNDNMIKPIQDALNGLVYVDDRQITDTVIRKTPIDGPIRARGLSLVLLEGFSRGEAFLHIQVDEAPDHSHALRIPQWKTSTSRPSPRNSARKGTRSSSSLRRGTCPTSWPG